MHFVSLPEQGLDIPEFRSVLAFNRVEEVTIPEVEGGTAFNSCKRIVTTNNPAKIHATRPIGHARSPKCFAGSEPAIASHLVRQQDTHRPNGLAKRIFSGDSKIV